LERAVAEGGVRALFIGAASQEGVASAFGAADVVTLPSHMEGLPAVICEAMLACRPVVASTVGGIPEVLVHGSTGYLAAPRDVGAFAALYARALSQRAEASSVAIAARTFALAHLTWEANARAYDRLYRSVLTERVAQARNRASDLVAADSA
jgi:glycosyltransferase involved in cell wall biosynthesis